MQIIHKEVHRLIQFEADKALVGIHKAKLRAHLEVCAECRDYLESVKDTEAVLRQTLGKQWSAIPLPLQMDVVYEKLNPRKSVNVVLTIRMTLAGIAILMFTFIARQSMTAVDPALRQSPPSEALLVPTPSTQYTVTHVLQGHCQEIIYVIQEGDTLESIARQFSVSVEALRSANHLTGESLDTTRELIVPICDKTPTITTHPPTFTTTPVIETVITTPG